MHPSSSLIYEPGAERGVPWGRDLFTFVTSAAGHMMRTLQRPRKSRPSKRQVNHRRFLHNMIHRKFAEIEAANRQLSSAIFSREVEGNQALSPLPVSTDQSDNAPGKESPTDMLPPTLPPGPTALSLSTSSPDNITISNQQEEVSSLWTFKLQSENPQEHMDLPHSHTCGIKMYDSDTKASQHTLKRRGSGTTVDERRTKWHSRSFDTSAQSVDVHPRANLQLERVKFDNSTRHPNTILDDSVSSWVENVKTYEIINSPDSEPNQQYDTTSQSSDIHALNLDEMPSPPVEPQSLASCAFVIQIATDAHCSLTNMNSTLENHQADIIDSFDFIDSDTGQGEEWIDYQASSGSVWGPPSEGTLWEMQFGSAFSNTASNMSSYDTGDFTGDRQASANRNMGMTTSNGTYSCVPDYLSASYPHFDALDQLRMKDGREHEDVDGDLGMRDSWGSDPTDTNETVTPTLNSWVGKGETHSEVTLDSLLITEGNDAFHKNYMTGYDSPSATCSIFPSLLHGGKGDSQCKLGGVELEDIGSEIHDIVSSAFLKSPLDTGLIQPSNSLGYYHVAPNSTSFPNSCSHNKNIFSCTRDGVYQAHTPFINVAKSFPAPKPHTLQVLTPPQEVDWLFDDIIGEGEMKENDTDTCIQGVKHYESQ